MSTRKTANTAKAAAEIKAAAAPKTEAVASEPTKARTRKASAPAKAAPKAAPKAAAKAAAPKTEAPKAASTRMTVNADSYVWRFAPTEAGLNGHRFPAEYSVAKTGDVFVFATVDGVALRIHVGKSDPRYHDAFEAAMGAKAAPKAAAPKAAPKAVAPKTEAPKAAAPKAAAKAAPKAAAKAAAKAAPKAADADKAWVGTSITGKGWAIAFDDAAQRTRVSFTGKPSAKQKAAVEAAGFYFSASLNSWNKKLSCKAYRAAQALAQTLAALK